MQPGRVTCAPKAYGSAAVTLTIQFYMDHHVPGSNTAGLRRQGIDVLPAYEDDAAELRLC